MGLYFGRNCPSASPNTTAPNPNPSHFKIISVKRVGRHCVAKIRYFGCTNFEGIKICLYLNITPAKLKAAKLLDPHFSETGLTPFARFYPTQKGEEAAEMLAKMLAGE